MITIEKLKLEHTEQLDALSVTEQQLKFVGSLEDILANVNGSIHPHVIVVKERVVGFFLIDTVYSEQYQFAQHDSLGLRGYFIGKNFQAMGYGSAAILALSHYLPSTYPNKSDVYLTVNCKNTNAKNCYLKGGFIEKEGLYLEGSAGPQHIMCLTFP
ncbi:GNAT family N-acetyltransferase [Vibrio sp. MA40-2]|uniref:GNAT family N-acetyltransferase n=1 Tax=Vibrio sp. MA40-2 TaxID=3391828 RepID=UPI0039A76FB6